MVEGKLVEHKDAFEQKYENPRRVRPVHICQKRLVQ